MTPPSPSQEPLSRSLVRRSGGMRKLLRARLWLRVMIGMALGSGWGRRWTRMSGW